MTAPLRKSYLTFVPTYGSTQLDALGDPTRRKLVQRLRRGPLAVTELAQGLPISRPAVSQHLAVLRKARLVRMEPAGTRRLYRLDPHGFHSLRAWFDSFWTDALDNFKARLEERP